jgi:hypothetical protein
MTRDEILNMPAGRKMDILVSEKVMHDIPGQAMISLYSTDIAAAWEVVEKMIEADGFFQMYYASTGEWLVDLDTEENLIGEKTAPLAICRAALLATMEVSDD